MPSFVFLSVGFLPIQTALAGNGTQGVNIMGSFWLWGLRRFPLPLHRDTGNLLAWGPAGGRSGDIRHTGMAT